LSMECDRVMKEKVKQMMQALVYYGPQQIVLERIEKPTRKQDEMLIRIDAVGICGSELEGINNRIILETWSGLKPLSDGPESFQNLIEGKSPFSKIILTSFHQ
jgi:hypothetical protein